ncbi:LacI family DNA-binding transcriptional regulator [Larkinella soli]|uniref:LacI family DNA-binding transcriptional regulator n=1 Tax=Larkinella soli TaxID=1770527 RepID=UPI001E5A7EA8|nr:LacI family DNA-binding transcriptional regulator [Larkinella soli]
MPIKETVTIKEIARRLGVAPSTVSRALQNHPRISAGMREAVHALALQLKYHPSAVARSLKSGRTGVIGVVLPEIRENFFCEVINGVEAVAFDRGYTVALYQSHDQYEREKQILGVLSSNRVDGVLLSVAKNSQRFDHVEDLIGQQIPVVLFDRIPPGIRTHQVSCDIEKGAYEATKWLARHGHRRIALLNGPLPLAASEERYRGYITALKEEALPVENGLIRRVDLTREDTVAKTGQLLSLAAPPDAILAFNDYVSLDAMQACRGRGLRINQDITFVSFANLPLNAYLEQPPAASVEQHPYQLGFSAADILMDSFDGKTDPATFQNRILEPELMVRV